jgi:hypothetical protein
MLFGPEQFGPVSHVDTGEISGRTLQRRKITGEKKTVSKSYWGEKNGDEK